MMLLAWALLIPALNYGMIKEEVKKQKTQETQVTTVFEIKEGIQKQIVELINLLDQKYLELSQQKGWLNWKDKQGEHQGILIALYNSVEPSKKSILKQIQSMMQKKNPMLFTQENSVEKNVFNLVAQINFMLDKIPHAMIETKIREYFGKYGNQIEIRDKGEGNGVQFGKIVRLIREGQQLEYYVKTHQLGLLSQTGRSAQSVDLKEPFAYKFLELCGIAPEVHFFYDDDKYFYIATKNEGYNFKGEIEFLTYDKVLSKEETKIAIYDNQKLLDYAFLMTDFYSRLLNLSDVLANHGNVGFIKKGYDFINFKIIDFRVPDTRADYQLKGILGGWENGNNEYNYTDEYVVELLKTFKDENKVKIKSEKIMPYLEKLQNIPEIAKEACNQILNIGKDVFANDIKFDGYAKDLISYTETVQAHYKELYEGVQSKL